MILKLSLLFLFQLLCCVSCEQFTFEIKKQHSENDLSSMKKRWDTQIKANSLFQQQQSGGRWASSTSNFRNSHNKKNEDSHFSRKFIAHFDLNQEDTNSTKLDHGNYTSFSLYTTYGNAYLVDIYVGSERQEFQVLLDTGSSYTWLTHTNCSTCQDIGINKFFDCEKSTTCGNQHEDIQITYGRGIVNATVYRDMIGFAHNKFIATNQDFLLVKAIEDLEFFPGHGLFGLGFNVMSDGRKTILDNLKEQGQITKRQFAFSLSGEAESVSYGMTNKDFFILGGDSVDPNLADDSDYFTCPCSFHPYWSVAVNSIAPIISDVEIDLHFQSKQAIIDSGTSFIIFNQADFDVLVKFFKKLKKLNCNIDHDYELLKCEITDYSVYPIFKFTLCEQSRHLLISPSQYLICDETVCYVRITGMSLGFGMENVIILGDIFLRTQYTVFNLDDSAISFYKKKISSESTPPQLQSEMLDTSLSFKNAKQETKNLKKSNKKQKQNVSENQSQKLKKEIRHKSP